MFTVSLIIVAIFWGVVGFFDLVFKSCMLHPYLVLLERNKITLKPCQLQWYTSRWNRLLQKLGNSKAKFLRKWFGFGAIVTSILIFPAVLLLLASTRSMLGTLYYADITDHILQPVLPGINLPLTHIAYYFIALLACSVFHELGHALAAVRENVKIQGCGLFIFGIFPGAFVDLPTENMMVLTSWQQLKVYCAGVWHNIVLTLFTSLLLHLNPFLFFPFYYHGNGITITNVLENSGVSDPAGLFQDDIITAINTCPIKVEDDWKKCILNAVQGLAHGYCVPLVFITQEDMSVKVLPKKDTFFNCCDKETQHGLCFHYWSTQDEKYSCLPVRKLLQQSGGMCQKSENCEDGSWACVTPFVNNGTKLLQLYRRGKKSMLFIGNPIELYRSVSVSNWIPRYKLISNIPLQIYEVFLRYVASFSAALAILNVCPCFVLDGFWIINALGQYILPNSILNLCHRKYIIMLIISFGTLLLILNVLLGFLMLMTK